MDQISKVANKPQNSNTIASVSKMIDASNAALVKIIQSDNKSINKQIDYSPLKRKKNGAQCKLSTSDQCAKVKQISPKIKSVVISATKSATNIGVIKSQSKLATKIEKNRIITPNATKTQIKGNNGTIPTVLSSNKVVNIPAIKSSNNPATIQTVLSLSNKLDTSSNLSVSNARISSISLKTTLDSPSVVTEEQFLIKKNWQPVEKIAYGGFSVVYKVFSTTQSSKTNLKINSMTDVQYFAAKVIRLNETNRIWVNKCLRHEMYISKLLKHENIVKTYHHFKSKTFAVIIMQLYVNGTIREDLDKRKRPYNSNEAVELFYGLMNGLSYMHRMNIAHRDLKLDNFFLSKTRKPFIGDFGFATLALRQSTLIIDSILRTTRCGSEWYMAPEVAVIVRDDDKQESPKVAGAGTINFSPTITKMGNAERSASKFKLKYRYNAKQADIYSMGVCFYEMLQRSFPFLKAKQKNTTRMTKNRSKRKIFGIEEENEHVQCSNSEIVFSGNIEKQLQDIIVSMLKFNPEQRPNADQLFKRISSIYYQKCLFRNNFRMQNPKCIIT